MTSTWHVVVPVKEREQAKTRLQPPAGVERAQLAAAIALDTLDAVIEVVGPANVVVVTSDSGVTEAMEALNVTVLRDTGRGLNAAIEAGLQHIAEHHDGAAGAVLLGDLPALNAEELYAGLRACAATESSVVPDFDGAGTVLLTHHDARRVQPRFGAGSADRHARTATVLALDLPRLRTDVDDNAGLKLAAELGLGRHTVAALDGKDIA